MGQFLLGIFSWTNLPIKRLEKHNLHVCSHSQISNQRFPPIIRPKKTPHLLISSCNVQRLVHANPQVGSLVERWEWGKKTWRIVGDLEMINLIQFCKFQTLGDYCSTLGEFHANFMKKIGLWELTFFLESRAARVILSDPTGQYFFEVFFLSVEMRIKKTWVFSNFWDSYTPKCSHIFLKHLQVDRIQYIPAGYAMQKPSYTSGQVRRFFPIMTGGGPHYPRWELGFPGLKTACLSPPLEGIAVQTYSHHWGTSWFQVGNRQCKLFC